MRLFRLGALVGSVVVLVATSVSMLNTRSELRSERDARATAAVLVADQSVESTIARAVAVVAVASERTDPADIAASFGADASACVAVGTDVRCTDGDLSALPGFGAAVSAAAGEPVVVVDESTDSLLVVARGGATTVLRVPEPALLTGRAATTIDDYGVEVDIGLSSSPFGPTERIGPVTNSGLRTITDTLGLEGEGGSVQVVASIADDIGLAGDGVVGYVILLALGTLLMGLAAWTFLLDRRALERRATTDELTGLVNRREFERVSEESLDAAARFGAGVCLLLIDLNGFKQINDTLGHQFGDVVLKAAAERLRSAVRDTDVVGRWGGDEFVILLDGVEDGSGVRATAERIGSTLAATPIAGDVTIRAAIGAALFPRHGSDLDELINAADVAMYGAKTTGVTYRLADAHARDLAPDAARSTTGYDGPDRRRQAQDA